MDAVCCGSDAEQIVNEWMTASLGSTGGRVLGRRPSSGPRARRAKDDWECWPAVERKRDAEEKTDGQVAEAVIVEEVDFLKGQPELDCR